MNSTASAAQNLSFAAHGISVGNLAIAEIVCREVLDVDPGNPGALNLLGVVSANLGLWDHAHSFFRAALKACPGDQAIRANLARVKSSRPAAKARTGHGEKFLLIKSWGCGFWSDVSHALGSLLLAEAAGRTPVIWWGSNSLFKDGSGRDAFALYFEPTGQFTPSELAASPNHTFFPPKWNARNLPEENVNKFSGSGSRVAALYLVNRPETIAVSDFYIGVIDAAPWLPEMHPMHGKPLATIYRYLVNKYLKPRETIVSACDEFCRAKFAGRPFIALHMRGSDKVTEDPTLADANEACLSAAKSLDASMPIFLLSDDERLKSRAQALFGDRIVSTECLRTSTATGVHFTPGADGANLGFEVMVDTYIALRADRFIGNGRSGVSAMIALMKDWAPGACTLINENLLLRRNLYLHGAA